MTRLVLVVSYCKPDKYFPLTYDQAMTFGLKYVAKIVSYFAKTFNYFLEFQSAINYPIVEKIFWSRKCK